MEFNDFGICKGICLIQHIERYILRLCLLLPGTWIVWSDILIRRSWHCAHNGTAFEPAVNTLVKNDGYCAIRALEKKFYRFDGANFSDRGYDIDDINLNNIQWAVETFIPVNLKIAVYFSENFTPEGGEVLWVCIDSFIWWDLARQRHSPVILSCIIPRIISYFYFRPLTYEVVFRPSPLISSMSGQLSL